MRRAYVLLSGGIDSTTALHVALRDGFDSIVGVSIDYGQRHAKETVFAQRTCQLLRLAHTFIDLHGIIPRTMLTDRAAEVPDISYSEIQGVSPIYVPFRNGLMLSAIASRAQGDRVRYAQVLPKSAELDEWAIYWGAHAEDAHNWAYPDCTPEFAGAMANAIFVGTYHKVRLLTPLQYLGKAEIIKLGTELGINWERTWSCYKGEEIHCGTCPTCRARRDGFKAAGITDPTPYKEDY